MSIDSDDIRSLTDSIDALTRKLDGVGIEIYHLNSAIGALKVAIKDLVETRMDD